VNDLSNLIQLIQNQLPDEDTEIDPKTLRYLIYARKSTEGSERQARSIPDQIADIYKDVINPLDISIHPTRDIFKEEKSAKEAGTREEFTKVINLIKDEKYDGVIAWHPDRLARNMKEAGEIIDLVDRGILKDLRFAKSSFENTPNGKMILGISFVLSKHYSEHLSESVDRGNRRITQSGGVLHKFKHGYRVMEGHKIAADGDNYLIINKAFELRQKGKTLIQIAEYINSTSYKMYWRGEGHREYVFDEDKVSIMLRDPIYAGVVIYGKNYGRIQDNDSSFSPMLSEQEFLQLHGEKSFLSKTFRYVAREDVDNSNFLRQAVHCTHCGRSMTTTAVPKILLEGKIHYFYFRCENKGGCVMYGKGPRGNMLIDYVLDFLDKHRFTTKEVYERYVTDLKEKMRFDSEEVDRIIGRATQQLGVKKREYENMKKAAADKENELSRHYTAHDLDMAHDEIVSLSKTLKEAKAAKALHSEAIDTYEQFLELFDSTVDLLRSTRGMAVADAIIRIFFLNFQVTGTKKSDKAKIVQWSVTSHTLREPYRTFVENGNFLCGRG
jgi:DNA invertase Pin-like site-specific DNA recombinase